MLSYLMGGLCGGVTTYNIGIWFVCRSINIDQMSLLSEYFKSKKKTQLRAITKWSRPKVMLNIFSISVSSIDTDFLVQFKIFIG